MKVKDWQPSQCNPFLSAFWWRIPGYIMPNGIIMEVMKSGIIWWDSKPEKKMGGHSYHFTATYIRTTLGHHHSGLLVRSLSKLAHSLSCYTRNTHSLGNIVKFYLTHRNNLKLHTKTLYFHSSPISWLAITITLFHSVTTKNSY